MSRRILNPESQSERDEFTHWFGLDGNCSCHISPPCGSCTHPGNPRNQAEDECCWTWETMADMLDDLEEEARASVVRFIDKATARHLSEMAAQRAAQAAQGGE